MILSLDLNSPLKNTLPTDFLNSPVLYFLLEGRENHAPILWQLRLLEPGKTFPLGVDTLLLAMVRTQLKKIRALTLAGVAHWVERQPANQKGRQFDSQSWHMPGLQARSPVGGV